jgi:polar amino acid transport system substrate-binding protein
MRPLLPWLVGLVVLAAPAVGRAETSLERIKRERVLRWGADPSGGAPFVFNDPNDPEHFIGFEAEIVEALCRRLGVRPELVSQDWASLIPSLERKDIDLVFNGLEITAERGKVVRFTTPYFAYLQQLTIQAGDRDRYRTLADLKGQRISVLNDSASVHVLEDAGWTRDLIDAQDDSLKPYNQLSSGRVKAVLAESIIARYYVKKNPELSRQLYNVPKIINPGNFVFSPGNYAGAVRPGADDADLLNAVNRALEDMKADGELAVIYRTWNVYGTRQQQIGVMPPEDEKRWKAAEEEAQRRLQAGAANVVPPDDEETDVSGEGADPEAAWGRIFLLLLQGAGMTLLLTAISMPLALLFGLALALMTMSGRAWLRWPAAAYIQVMRGTPLLVQIFVIYFSLPKLGNLLGTELLAWPAFAVGVLCLAANYAAYEAEIHRAGLEAIPRGQREAALSLGMTEGQALRHVVLPQSFRVILPPVVNDLVSMLKDSCLVSIMGVGELLRAAESTGKSTFHYGEMLLLAAALYFVLSFVCDRFGKYLEERLKRQGAPILDAVPAHH